MSEHACCGPTRDATGAPPAPGTPPAPAQPSAEPPAGAHRIEQAHVPAGVLAMGDHNGDHNEFDGELPVHEVRLEAFDIDATTVTNADFAVFVDATGYVTESERFGFSAVFHLLVRADRADIVGRPGQTPWWLGVRGPTGATPAGRSPTWTAWTTTPSCR
nr:SUMF1/EgtB/PvdO family nonheme iron enzyme [Propioniciclava coleopterorum]